MLLALPHALQHFGRDVSSATTVSKTFAKHASDLTVTWEQTLLAGQGPSAT